MKIKILLLIFALGVTAPQAEAQVWLKALIEAGKTIKQNRKEFKNEKSPDSAETPNKVMTETLQNQDLTTKAEKSTDEITLVVSADGTTKEEATKLALRSAIEQAYGTFVSANTTLLNDELVKDEIVTVSSGNVKEYKEIASNVMPDGKTFVTLQATVCISKLVSYAQSKGAETEFAGATFAMNMKMKELNKQNEMKALQNLLVQVKELIPISFEKRLIIQDPKLIDQTIIGDWRKDGYKMAWNSTDPIDEKNVKQSIDRWLANADESYLMTMQLQFIPNSNMGILEWLIHSTLSSLSLTENEIDEYEKYNMKTYNFTVRYSYIEYGRPHREKGYTLRYNEYTLRNDIRAWYAQITDALEKEYSSYKIVDNTGQESYFDGYEILKIANYSKDENIEIRFARRGDGHTYYTEGHGLLSPYFELKLYYDEPYAKYWTAQFLLPKSDISKYSSFRVERRN